MIISDTNSVNTKPVNSFLKNNKNFPKFCIPEEEPQIDSEVKKALSAYTDPAANMEKMTGTAVRRTPSYTVTDEEADYLREKYGEEYDEENPYQLFYELAEKNIISSDDAGNASGYGRIGRVQFSRDIMPWEDVCALVNSGEVKAYVVSEHYSDYNCYERYYNRFMGDYEKEINTWQDAARQQYDFYRYLIDLDEELLTPDGTHYQSGKEQMNAGFEKTCAGILKVIDVLGQIFG